MYKSRLFFTKAGTVLLPRPSRPLLQMEFLHAACGIENCPHTSLFSQISPAENACSRSYESNLPSVRALICSISRVRLPYRFQNYCVSHIYDPGQTEYPVEETHEWLKGCSKYKLPAELRPVQLPQEFRSDQSTGPARANGISLGFILWVTTGKYVRPSYKPMEFWLSGF